MSAEGREEAVLYMFGFERIGVVASDLYFIDPRPRPGQEGAERGVRLEVRMIRPGELKGSIYSARPIEAAEPVWRADLLEAASAPGTLNRAHHHPRFNSWDPGRRVFDEALSADPVSWVGEQLSDLPGLLERAGVADYETFAADAAGVRDCVPQIMAAVRSLLERVAAGELAAAPAAGDGTAAAPASARVSWL